MDKDRVKTFSQRIFKDMAGAMTAGFCYLGHKTGLFKTMANQGPLTLEQVVQYSGLQSRYVEEWLKGMACSGYLDYDSTEDIYNLPNEHAYLLASERTDHFAGGLFQMVPGTLAVAPQVAEAFHEGGGVAFDAYHDDIIEAINLINRGNYDHRLVSYWLKAIPGLIESLEAGGRTLDVGCGVGRVSLVLAEAFPNLECIGIDTHGGSIERAISEVEANGLHTRVSFSQKTIHELSDKASFDLITLSDCLHDFVQPLEMLHEIHKRLKENGVLFIIEPKVADNLEDNQNDITTMLYGFSIFHCMTQSLAKGGPGLGTCMGPKATEALVRKAGFTYFKTLDIKSQVNSFYLVKA